MIKDNRHVTEKHMATAKAVGLILLGKTESKNKKSYQFEECKHVQDIGIKEVVENRFKCQTCFQIDLARRAEIQGLTLIGNGRNTLHRTYQVKDCNHIQEIATSNVDQGNFGCASCRERKLLDEALRAGVILRGPGSSAHYRFYMIKKCGHTLDIKTQSVRDISFKCKICTEKQFIIEAEKVGLTLLGEASAALDVSIKSSNYRLYSIDTCEHQQNFKLSHVREGSFNCNECNIEDIENRAYQSGWEYVGKNKYNSLHDVQCLKAKHPSEIETGKLGRGKIQCVDCFEDKLRIEANLLKLTFLGDADRKTYDANYRLYSCNRCQNEMTLRFGNLKRGAFLCEHCDDTYLDFPSNVYLLHIQTQEFDWLKLGYSKDIRSRIKGYGLSDECYVTILKSLPCDTGRSAKKKELLIHAKYKSEYRLDLNYMKQFHKLNGFTECYPISLREVLEQEIVKLQ
jgi:hypothetical protein